MDRNTINWRGYIPSMTTPFDETGELDLDAARELYQWVSTQHVSAIIVLGTQGEWFSLNSSEKSSVLRTASESCDKSTTLIAGCNAFTADEVLKNIRSAADQGFSGALVCPPPYMVPNEREIHTFYSDINKSSPLPICIYNWPPGTNIDMSLPLLGSLAELDKVVAIKHSTPSLRNFLDVFFGLKDRVRVFGIPMTELGISLVKHHNGDGTMGAAAVLGQDHAAFYEGIWENNLDKARSAGAKDTILLRSWFNSDYTGRHGAAQAIYKEALNQLGLPGGYPRAPLLPLDAEGREQVRNTLTELGKLP